MSQIRTTDEFPIKLFHYYVKSKAPKIALKDLQQMSLLGLSGEVGELVDMMKKHYYYDKPIDRKNAIEECGDILHYLFMFLNTIDIDIETVVQSNMDKLNKRYPNGFSKRDAIARNDKKRGNKK